MELLIWNNLNDNEKQKVFSRPAIKSSDKVEKIVNDVINKVISDKDKALIEFTKKFDNIHLKNIKLSKDCINCACKKINISLKKAINNAYDNIYKFHEAQKMEDLEIETANGIRCGLLTRPINKVGLYIPGGSAPLLSTVLMLAIPAKIAGCKEISLCSPPEIADEILYVANLCNIENIYSVGGAQAIAAFAFGTESIGKVDKIFGPGNIFVTEAKKQVSSTLNQVSIDMQAGPSEVLVIADEYANEDFVSSDLLSQAEHDINAQVMLVTTSYKLFKNISNVIGKQLLQLSRSNIIKMSLKNSKIILAKDIYQCIEISNRYAPEHLIMQVKNARDYLPFLDNAGSVFLGDYSPEAMGDYASGTNHVLPTYGFAKTTSGLGLLDFCKRMTFQEINVFGFKNLAKTVEIMATAELLDAHKNAISIRSKYIDK